VILNSRRILPAPLPEFAKVAVSQFVFVDGLNFSIDSEMGRFASFEKEVFRVVFDGEVTEAVEIVGGVVGHGLSKQ
jgi:hypothetical protein